MSKPTIRNMKPADWSAVSRIYQEGIDTGIATFETEIPEREIWNEAHLQHSRLVAIVDEQVLGWAALSGVSDRCVYGGVAEVSIYVSEDRQGQGIGRMLLEALINQSEENGIWTLQAGIFPENSGSIQLHKNCGFRIVGKREKLGCLHGEWKDVTLLERRSSVTGT